MKSFIIAIVYVAFVCQLAQAGRPSSHEWMQFKRQHGKSYESPAEDARRFAIFMATKQRVERHNAKGDSSFEMGLNHLSDWTQEELAKLNGFKVDESTFMRAQEKLNETEAYLAEILGSCDDPTPDEFDWRTVPGRVSAVKFQGEFCASDWAFSAIGVLEGQEYARIFNNASPVIELSAQELVDCSRSNFGCDSGTPIDALEDLKQLGGIMPDKDYPYTTNEADCTFDKTKAIMTVAGYATLPSYDENQLKQVLAKFGPISVSIQATRAFPAYKSGVLVDDDCTSKRLDLNRAALLVGYGTDPEQGDYWIVKNSLGADWGEKGYFRIKRGANMCGIALLPIIPKF